MMKMKLLLMLLAIALVAGVAQANLLVNPGFEEGTFTGNDAMPDYWVHWYTSYDPGHTWVNDADEAHSGEKYMKVNNWTTGTWSSSGWLGQDVLVVKEGEDYSFSVWVKNAAESQTNLAAMQVEWLNYFNNWMGSDYITIPVTDSDWIEIDFGTFTAPEGAAKAMFWLAAPASNGENATCYDDASMIGPDPNINAGPDMVSWDGETVSLTGSESLEGSYSTIIWTAEPAGSVTIASGDTLEPDVTITLPSPDLTTYTLRLDIDGKYDVVKIDVYPDACAAKLGAGLREATDVVGDDCITDLADLAELVKTWPVHNALTESTAKEGQGPGPAPVSALDVFNLNFYFYAWYWDSVDHHTVTLEEDEFAGFDTWLTGGWENIEIPWNDIEDPEAVEITSNQGSTATFTLLNVRNGWSAGDPVLTDVGNDEMMNALCFGTEDDGKGQPEFPTQIIDMTVSDIPFVRTYDVIIYLAKNVDPAIAGDGTGKIVFNGGPEQDITVMDGPFDGTFTEVVDGVTPGNYVLYEGVTGDSFTIQMWGNGWNHIGFCGLQFRSNFSFNSSPANGVYIEPTSELELSWTNLDPNHPPVSSVWVDAWFGTDPNDYNDFNKIVDTVEDANSVTVDASTEGTYYWQVNSYIYGDPATVYYNNIDGTDPNGGFPIAEGPMWRFHAATDVPVLIDAGPDIVTWSGEPVELEPSIDDDGTSALNFAWSVDPDDGVEFSATDVEDPTVTITKTPGVVEIIIINPGFEDPPYADGEWAYDLPAPWRDGYYWPSGSGDWVDDAYSAGIENPDTAYGGIVPEGENAAFQYSYYDDTYGGYDMGLRQVLAATLAPDTHYELSVMVGNPDAVASNDYRVELLAGGLVLNASTGPSPAPDTWTATPVTVTYDSPSTVDVGRSLEIRLVLEDDGSTDQLLNFDDVQLTATGSAYPMTVELTVSVHDEVGSDEDTMTIDVYDNPCLAATIGFGQEYDPGDVDADCDTDLADFAVIAEEWLVYGELEDPVIKP